MLWLLEELGVEYNLITYNRVEGRAPPELAKIHPLGKSPILVTAEGRSVVESSAIITYLLKTFDRDGRFASDDWLREETLTSFSGATMGPVNAIKLVFEMLPKRSPWPVSTLMKTVHNMVQKTFTNGEYTKMAKYLDTELGDAEWFNGKELGKADFMLSWPMDNIAQRGWLDFEAWPRLKAWRQRILERDAWKKGIQKGNGYDLTAW